MILVFKVTNPCNDHSYAMFIAVLESQLVFYRASRLDNSFHTLLIRYLYTIGEREKASLAITAPFKSNSNDFAFSMACFNASTREV